jgi:hypothetical protein
MERPPKLVETTQAAALRRFIESSKEAPILQRLTGTGYSNAQEK